MMNEKLVVLGLGLDLRSDAAQLEYIDGLLNISRGPLTVTMSDPETDSGNLIHSQWTGSACSSSSPNHHVVDL